MMEFRARFAGWARHPPSLPPSFPPSFLRSPPFSLTPSCPSLSSVRPVPTLLANLAEYPTDCMNAVWYELGQEVRSSVMVKVGTGRSHWRAGKITKCQLQEGSLQRVFDVRLDNGRILEEQPEKHVLFCSDSGAGALLRAAASAGNVKLVDQLLAGHVSCFEADWHGNTALHEAARVGKIDICRRLVEQRADPQMHNFCHESPIIMARQRRHMAVVRLFLPTSSDQDCVAESLELMHADEITRVFCEKAAEGDLKKVEAFLAYLDNCQQVSEILSLRTSTAWSHQLDKEDLLRGFSKSIFTPTVGGGGEGRGDRADDGEAGEGQATRFVTPLMLAGRGGHEKIVDALLAAKASVYELSPNGNSALSMAAECGSEPIVRRLLEHLFPSSPFSASSSDTSVGGEGSNGMGCGLALHLAKEALRVACINGHEECAQLLLNQIADHEAELQQPQLPLSQPQPQPVYVTVGPAKVDDVASASHRRWSGSPIVRSNSSLLRELISDQSLLVWAAEGGHTPVCRLLLEWQADVNHFRESGNDYYLSTNSVNPTRKKANLRTPLMAACDMGHAACVELLLERRAAVEATRCEGNFLGVTALMFAARHAHEKCIEMLLEAKATVDQQQSDGGSALMCTRVQCSNKQGVSSFVAYSPACKPYIHAYIRNPSYLSTVYARTSSCDEILRRHR
mmetsp:Transcript_85428/g.170526  ORF Transcript_85428/g.170526 Transcript_85428/m.170526 type:complete len:681 (-) Transcript_85428:766-2808(-)